jgi:uncharacterized protein YjiS (DUF1127 family)
MSCGATSCSSPANFYSSANPRAVRLATLLFGISRVVRRALERRRQRLALLGLDDWMLKDIGVTRDQALKEGQKPFWR